MIKRGLESTTKRKRASPRNHGRGAGGEPNPPRQHALTMLETIPDAVLNLNERFECLYVNAAAERILGMTREELLGRTIWGSVPLRQDSPFERQVRKTVEAGDRTEFGGPLTSDAAFYHFVISPCRDGAMVFIREETEKQRLRAALEESRAWRELIFKNVTDFAIFSMDVTGRVTLWNPGAERMFGYSAEEMRGRRTDPIFVPEDREARMPDKELEDAKKNKAAKDERWHLRKDGTRFFASGAVVPLYDEKGSLRGFTKVARDITERKKLEDELLTARQHLEEVVAERTAKLKRTISELELFSYSISHDLRAPLRAMRSFAQVLCQNLSNKLDARSAEYLSKISGGADRLDRLIQDVLNYSRVGRGEVQLDVVDLQELLEAIIHEQPALEAASEQIKIVAPLHRVLAHQASLTQALSNLLTNAIKFIPPGATAEVRVRTELCGENVRIWVEDHGIGIPEAHLDRIFGIFQRTPEGEKYEGTGIGLAIVRRAVESMGGHVGVESVPGKGSKFWVDLRGAQTT